MYTFFYVDKHNEKYEFSGLSKSKAMAMYRVFNRDMCIHGHLKVGWKETGYVCS